MASLGLNMEDSVWENDFRNHGLQVFWQDLRIAVAVIIIDYLL